MRLALLFALLPLAAAREPMSPTARDRGVARLADDTEARWVPFDLTPGNQIRFTLQLDGRAITAILDTGVSYTLLAKSSAAIRPAALVAGGTAAAIGGSVALGWMPTRRLAIGGLTRTGGGVTVADLPAIATGSADAVDMLVGRDLLAAYALDIDYAGRRFRLLRSGRIPFAGTAAPLTISARRQVYESTATLGVRVLAPLVVDTGDGSSVTVSDADWRAARLTGLPTTTTISFGLAGAAVSGLAIVPTIRLGRLAARSVEVRIEGPGGFSQAIGTAGRIGSGFLQSYRVLLDPGAGRMILAPNAQAGIPPLRSTSGLLVGVQPNRLKILHVMRGGPAAATGWKAGDTICRIDGTAIPDDYPTSPLATWAVGTPGRVVRLTACDGTTRELTLRRFY